MLIGAKRRAHVLKLPCSITVEDIAAVWPKNNLCPVFGTEMISNLRGRGPKLNSPSLDKIKPWLGYVPGNIAVISYRANMLKQREIDPAAFRRLADWLETVVS